MDFHTKGHSIYPGRPDLASELPLVPRVHSIFLSTYPLLTRFSEGVNESASFDLSIFSRGVAENSIFFKV